jgi:Protein of unknown function (DUF4254)
MRTSDLPSVATVVTEFRRALESPAVPTTGLLGALVGLHVNNLSQWEQEDAARDPAASDAVAVAVKREIDRLNLARHRLIEQVDTLIADAVGQAGDAPPVTESPGMAFDRLSVLVIRLHHTELTAGRGGSGAAPYLERLPVLREQLAWLEVALEQLLGDLQAGQRSFLPYQNFKLYRSPEEPPPPASSL